MQFLRVGGLGVCLAYGVHFLHHPLGFGEILFDIALRADPVDIGPDAFRDARSRSSAGGPRPARIGEQVPHFAGAELASPKRLNVSPIAVCERLHEVGDPRRPACAYAVGLSVGGRGFQAVEICSGYVADVNEIAILLAVFVDHGRQADQGSGDVLQRNLLVHGVSQAASQSEEVDERLDHGAQAGAFGLSGDPWVVWHLDLFHPRSQQAGLDKNLHVQERAS